MSHNVKSTLKQRCVRQRWNLQHRTTLKQRCGFQRWIEQRQTTSKQRCHFQHRFSQRWSTSKQRCEFEHLKKNYASIQKQNNIFDLQRICWTQNFTHFLPILRGSCKRTFAELQKPLKHRIYWITKSEFKSSHFVKCQLIFNFKRQVQAHYDYHSFNVIFIF